jgi:hypothetical protein
VGLAAALSHITGYDWRFAPYARYAPYFAPILEWLPDPAGSNHFTIRKAFFDNSRRPSLSGVERWRQDRRYQMALGQDWLAESFEHYGAGQVCERGTGQDDLAATHP